MAQTSKEAAPSAPPKGEVAKSKQSVTLDGKVIPLSAEAGTLQLKDENNKPIALYGYTAYFKDNPEKNRPIVFAYNGGPGSSSYWLHMGIMGPKRIVVDDPNYNPAAPYELTNNEFSILDVADVVIAVFDLRTLFFAPNEDLPYIVYLPTVAATSWYHKKVANPGSNLPAFVQQVREFVEKEYAPALFKGNRITAAEKTSIAKKLEGFTGITSAVWERADLRITPGEYYQELLRGEGMTVGRLDSRYKGVNLDPMAMSAFTDPQSDAISPAYTMGFLDYYHGSLGVSKDLSYATSAYAKEGFKWDWKHQGNNFWGADAAVTTVPDMAEALSKDPHVEILIMNGYYDLATVFHGVEHSIAHMGLPSSATDRIKMTYYEAGHMMYTHLPSAAQLRQDLKSFIQSTVSK